MALKVSPSRELRMVGRMVRLEDRSFFNFRLVDGRVAGTKAMTVDEARKRIESILEVEVKEVV